MAKKNSYLTDTNFIKALRSFLGFSGKQEDVVSEHALKYNHLAEKFTLNQEKKDELYRSITKSLENRTVKDTVNSSRVSAYENSSIEKINKKISIFENLRANVFRSFALSLAFAVGLLFGIIFSHWDFLTNDFAKVEKKLIIYNGSKFESFKASRKYNNKFYTAGQYGEKLHFWSRGLEGFRVEANTKDYHVYFKRGKVLFQFDNKKQDGKLYVHVPDRIIKVVGTEFLVDIKENKTSIILKKGKIKIEEKRNGKVISLEKNQLWKSGNDKIYLVNKKKTLKLFNIFKQSKIHFSRIKKLSLKLEKSNNKNQNSKQAQKQSKKFKVNFNAIVYMKNGEKISGKIISVGKEKIWFHTNIVDSLEIPRNKIDKIEYK